MMALLKKKHSEAAQVPFYAAALIAAFVFKYHYSHANADALVWMLAPAAHLVEMVLPVEFEWENGLGYVCRDKNILIAPVCAGVNFLIISFSMTAFYGIRRLRDTAERSLWLLLSLITAYGYTLAINALRIGISIYLYAFHIGTGWFTPQRIHLIAGIFLYVTGLYIAYFAVHFALNRSGCKQVKQPEVRLQSTRERGVSAGWIPLAWYGSVTLGIPLINGELGNNSRQFMEYAAILVGVCAAIGLPIICLKIFLDRKADLY